MGSNHAVASMAFIGKQVDKKSTSGDVVMKLVKKHHGEVKGLIAEKIREAHQRRTRGKVEAARVVQTPQEMEETPVAAAGGGALQRSDCTRVSKGIAVLSRETRR